MRNLSFCCESGFVEFQKSETARFHFIFLELQVNLRFLKMEIEVV